VPVISAVPSDTQLPERAAVVVIGGGIIGTCIALELAERGVDVVLVEKGEIACEQSSRNWGWCRQMGRDPRELPLARVSLDLWRGMNARVDAETGYRQCGIVYFSETEAQLAGKRAWFEANARAFGLKTDMITAAQAADLLPGATRPLVGGMYTTDDGRAEPFIATPAIALAARRKGAKIFTHCAARGFETSAGRVSHIVTEKGAIACDTAVVAGGAWTRRFLHNAGVPFKQLGVISSVMRTEARDIGHERTGSGSRFTFRKRLDGGFTVTHQHFVVADIVPDSFRLFFDFLPALRLDWSGLKLRLGRRFIDEARLKRRWRLDERSPFEDVRILDPEPVRRILDEALLDLQSLFPAFQGIEIAERWAGLIDATPDVIPVISETGKLPGLFIASGFSGHGFGLGPGAARLAAQMVLGENPCVDPLPFRYARQFDGAPPRPTTGT
jgi:glycine/D-amino acid oxidase-like deaminating enzyme